MLREMLSQVGVTLEAHYAINVFSPTYYFDEMVLIFISLDALKGLRPLSAWRNISVLRKIKTYSIMNISFTL